MLEGKVVNYAQAKIGDGQSAKQRVNEKGAGQRNKCEQDGENDGDGRLQPAGGDGAIAFQGMLAVGLGVQQVVNEIDRAGEKTEKREGDKGRCQGFFILQSLREDNAGKENEVLAPLPGTYAFQ